MEHSSKIWKLFFGSGSVTLFNTLRAFVINKLLAVFLPPAAFACVGQFMNWMSIGQATSSLAMQNGWVSLTAQNKDNVKNLHGVWRGGFRLTTFATIFTCVAAVIFCFVAPLNKLLPGVYPRYAQAAILFALPGILATNMVAICSAVMNGLGLVKRWALIQIVASLFQMLWVAFFLYSGRLSVLSIIATQSVVAGIFAARVAARAGFNIKTFRESVLDIRGPWMSYAVMGLVPMIVAPLVLMFVRSFIGSELGWNAAGIWQGVYKISDFFASIFSAILGVLILPRISREMTRESFRREFYPIFLRMMGFTLVFCIALYFGRSLVVSILLSGTYAPAANYMPIQLVGDLFRSGAWCFGMVLIARRETKLFLIIEVGANLLFAGATIAGVKLYEMHGPMLGYAVENFVTFVALAISVRRLKWNTP
ncbi:MAG: O-antigen translocase [Fibrobacter sp.]|nr:O-antigen translocase [Fibrobacter sp.]